MIKLDESSELNILNMLVDHKALSPQQFKQIQTLSDEGGKSKLTTAFELNLVDNENILRVLSESYSLPRVDLKRIVITDQIRKLASLRYLKDNIIIPFEVTGDVIKLAITDASKLGLIKNIKPNEKPDKIENLLKFFLSKYHFVKKNRFNVLKEVSDKSIK